MAKVKQADLKREIEAQDRKDSRKKSFNVNALRLMLAAAKGVKDSESFANAFTPTRGTNSIARKLKLGLDVVRGQWVFENGKHNPGLNRIRESHMRNVNEVVDGSKLIELLMQALEEGDTVRVSEISNQILSQKVSECLVDRRILIAERLFNEDLADLVKVLEEKFGVSAVAMAAPAAASVAGSDSGAVAEEKSEYKVVLKDMGSEKIKVIKALRQVMTLGLGEAKKMVESAPVTLVEAASKEDAQKMKEVLEGAGASVDLA